jgi:hypothetical protein
MLGFGPLGPGQLGGRLDSVVDDTAIISTMTDTPNGYVPATLGIDPERPWTSNEQRPMPPVGDLTDAPDAPTRIWVKAHGNVFGLTIGEQGWIPNNEEAVEAARLGAISFVAEPDT